MLAIGAVGYLNALPLIHNLDRGNGIRLVRKVPADLLMGLETERLDVALCPVIDAQTSSHDLIVVPSGAIGSRSKTLTVRIFSKCPLDEIRCLHVDGDSHTSIALAQVIFHRRLGRIPEIVPLRQPGDLDHRGDIEAALLIGDKVITAEPPRTRFPHQLDLGEAWREMTGLPFVFAAWLARRNTDLGDLPRVLEKVRRENCNHLEDRVGAWARAHGWPEEGALVYLRDLLDYDLGPQQLEAMRLFWKECANLGIINTLRTIDILGSEP
jgi:chorismate dehydratase